MPAISGKCFGRSKRALCATALVALRSCHLARQGLVEVAAVVEPRQGVEVGELPRLAEAAGVLDRGAGPPGQLLELPDHAFLEAERW